MGGGSLASTLMVSMMDVEVEGLVVAGGDPRRELRKAVERGGEDNGGGVDLGVSKRLSLLLIGDICGIKVWEVRVVGGAPDT
ncbi:hypothetical protein Tco_0156832 [Tanacetum coccineum]